MVLYDLGCLASPVQLTSYSTCDTMRPHSLWLFCYGGIKLPLLYSPTFSPGKFLGSLFWDCADLFPHFILPLMLFSSFPSFLLAVISRHKHFINLFTWLASASTEVCSPLKILGFKQYLTHCRGSIHSHASKWMNLAKIYLQLFLHITFSNVSVFP